MELAVLSASHAWPQTLNPKPCYAAQVNKQSLAQHYIGLHNESTFKKTATYGAFVCFNPATEGGGEFFIADGAKIFRDMKTEVLEKFYNKVTTWHHMSDSITWRSCTTS
jgi:hypothetical protein